MLIPFLGVAVCRLVYFVLHVNPSGSFPKPLSAVEEKECLSRMQQGDQEAQNTLIEHNLRLVMHIIKKYYANARDQEDLLSVGTIGLIKGVLTFKQDKGTRLATYAARCIENEILMNFRSQKKSAQDVSISDPIDIDKDGNQLTLMDIVRCDDTIIDDVDLRIKSEKLYQYIQKLPARERAIVEMRYGLRGKEPQTQREVAGKMHISRSYVSRIEKKALGELRNLFVEAGQLAE